MTFTVTLGAAVQGGLTVTPSFTDVTATEGTDYDENTTALSFSGTKGETKTFTVSTTEDAVLEANETFTVELSVSNSSVTSTDTGTGTINNNDSATVTVNDASADEGDSMTFTVTLSAAVQGGLKVTPGYTDGTASSSDYTRNTTALSFTGTANETKTFTVQTTEDTALEADEAFTVGLSVSDAPTGVTSTDTGTGTINNDDGAGVIIADAAATEGQSITFTVTLTEAVQGGLTVTPGFTDGTAIEGTDYTENTTPLNFSGTANETQTFTVQTTEDTVVEGNETFIVDLSVSGTSLSVDATATGTGTINNDDKTPSVNLSVTPARVAENDGATLTKVTATFSNSSTYEAATTVTVSVGDGTDSAVSGTDYADVADFTITIAAGTSSGTGTFTLTPTDDTLVEGVEAITVSGTNTTLTVNSTQLILTDNDDPPTIDLLTDASVPENAGPTQTTLTARFSNASTYATDITVTVTVGNGQDSATLGTDYTPVTSFTVVIAAGASSGAIPFTLTPIDDTLIEGNENLTVDGTADNGLPVNDADVKLIDDDGGLAINLSVNPARAAENDGAIPMTVTAAFSNSSTYDTDTTVTVTVGDGSDSATEGVDYQTVAAFTVTIAAGASSGSAPFTLTPINDTLAEGDETLSVAGTAANGLTVNGAHVTLVDDDVVIDLSVTPARVAEDAGATPVTVTATFSNAVTYDTATTVTVTVGDTGDSATEGVDYQSVASFTVTIAAGASSGSTPFTLTPIDDTLVEDDETISVNGAADRDLTVNGTHLTLTDAAGTTAEAVSDDASDDFATVTVSNARALEGDTMTFTLTLDKATTGSFTVTPVYSDGTATADADYTPNTSSVAFAGQAGEQHTFTVATLADDLVEPAETFGVSLAITGPSGIRGRSGSGTIDSNDVVTVVAVVSQDDPDLPTTLHEAGSARG